MVVWLIQLGVYMSDVALKPLVCGNPLAKLAKAAIMLEFVNENYLEERTAQLGENGYKLLSPLSHFGGNPHLPKDFVWPCAKHGETELVDRPLVFSAQFDLSELAPFDVDNLLPHKGLLVFFTIGQMWNFQDYEDSSRVYYFEDIESLAVTARPPEPPYKDEYEQESSTLAFHRVCAKAAWTVPNECDNVLYESDFSGELSPFGLTKDQMKDIHDNYEAYYTQLREQDGFEEYDDVPSQLLGWGQYIQSDLVGSSNECLLFTLSSFFDEKIKDYPLCIGDAGAIYHIMDVSDLKEQKFGEVRSVMDCY